MTVLMTGFPGFLGRALLPRILARTDGDAVCLVQDKFMSLAADRVAEMVRAERKLAGRIRLLPGDVTRPGLGLEADAVPADSVTELWHLAAVYDLAVPRDLAMRVNVEGTRYVLEFAASCPRLARLHYFSTCYVSGRFAGPYREDDLDRHGPFNNFYEETKHYAEIEVRRRMAEGLPGTIYRPSIVVGDSVTGETQKFDGPYFLIRWLLRQPRLAVLPIVGDPAMCTVNVVPVDFVIDAVGHLSGLAESAGRTYHLADPRPLTVEQMIEVLAEATDRRVVTVPLTPRLAKGAIRRVPGVHRLLGMPAEIVDYFVQPTSYLTDHADRDLAGSSVSVPEFTKYADVLVSFIEAHPEISSAAMA